MKNFLKLTNFEINRFSKIYFALLAITLVLQFVGVFMGIHNYESNYNEVMRVDNLTDAAYIEQYGGLNFTNVSSSMWFASSIALCAVALIFYIFLIWYRDWFGKNTFIYRLLMLPTSRLSIFTSKAAAILLMVFGLIAFQLILLPIENALFNQLAPANLVDYKMSVPMILQTSVILIIIIPSTLAQFFISYGIGLMAMLVLFCGIMFERSYRWKGIILGVLYCIAAGLVFLLPVFITVNEEVNLYPGEIFASLIMTGVIVAGFSLWFGTWLLKKRVTV